MMLLVRLTALILVSAAIALALYLWARGPDIDVGLFYKTAVPPESLARIQFVLQISLFVATFSTLTLLYLVLTGRKNF
jgi:multisubunit Na+/H+ antiporter MnhF subunit